MEKAHSRIKWENYPSIATPLNETNLNKMDIALDEVDNRVLGLDTAKLDKAVANSMVKDITFDEATGIFTITSLDGTTKTVDTKLEKVATNFSYDYETQKLKLTLLDGTEQEIDMSTLISQYEFADTSTIGFTVGNEGKITAIVKDGSVTEDKLQPNFLADIKVEVAKGKSYSDSSYENATTSSNASKEAKQYRDEAKQFRDEAQAMSGVEIATTEKAGLVKPDGTTIRVDEDGTIHADAGTVDYTELENKPSINGTELEGNKTLDELGIASKGKVETLETELAKTTYKVDTVIANIDLGIKETASGEEIHLIDSAEGKAVEFALYGKAKQNTTSGKNLIPYPYYDKTKTLYEVTYTDNGDGSITVNGTATANGSFVFNPRIDNTMILGAGEYKVSGCPSGGSNTTYRLMVAKTSATGSFEVITRDLGSGATFTLTEDTDIYVGFEILSGITVNNLIVKPMVYLASITDDTWEQPTNGATPRPDYPQEIEVSGESGSVEVKSVGKNLLPYPYKNTSSTNRGITFTAKSDGSIDFSGTATDGRTSFMNLLEFILLPAGTYKVGSGSNKYGGLSLYFYDDEGVTKYSGESEGLIVGASEVYINTDKNGNGIWATDNTYGYEKEFTIDKDAYLRIQARSINNTYTQAISGTIYPMIRHANITDDTWQSYKETLATIPTPNGLAGIKVTSNGNYTDQNGQQWICDEVVKYADGSGALIQRVKKKVYDGVNNVCNWAGTTNNGTETLVQMNLGGNSDFVFIRADYIMCDMFKNTEYYTSKDAKVYACRQGTNGDICCYFKESDVVTGLASANAWLQENNVTVYYILKEPITTPLTAEELAEISTFYPITNVSNDFDCGMSVKYNADSKNYIDKMVAEKVASIVANMNN